MKLRKCVNGHFYDEDKFAFCPHCQQAEGQNGPGGGSYKGLVQVQEFTPTPLEKQVQHLQNTDEDVTVGYYSRKMGKEPVVGWLVCVEGENKGESYQLKAGRNFIGRGEDMDIILSGDKSVSRNKHAIVVYEPKARIFIAQPGESRELFYINDEVVLSGREIHARDVFLIGNSRLVFIPFCGEKFSWDD